MRAACRGIAPLLFAAALLGVLPALLRAAEEPPPAELSPAARERLYQELAAEVALLEERNVLKRVVRLVRPTVVHLEASKSEAVGATARRAVEESGSGVVVEIGGRHYVLTNRHVIAEAELERIKVGLADGRQLRPVRRWEDPATDVGVLEIQAEGLIAARLGDSAKVEIGDFVLAVGSPFGLSHSVTFGIISATGRRDLKLGAAPVRFQDFFQTDAAINPGNSGGPLINLRGEVIGINTAIASASGGNEGIGFTIPINMFMVVARQLIERGKVTRSFLGVHLDGQFTAEKAQALGLSRPQGARVTGITPGSPAARLQLRADDVILEFDGVRVENDSHLVNLVSLTPQGKEVPLVVLREGKRLSFRVEVGDREQFQP